MFAEQSASRGKQKKSAGNEQPAGNGGRGGRSGGETGGGGDKRSIQKATKAQRKSGGMKRGGDYEVEDLGALYSQGLEAQTAKSSGSRGAGSKRREEPKGRGGWRSKEESDSDDAEEEEEEEAEEEESEDEEEEEVPVPSKRKKAGGSVLSRRSQQESSSSTALPPDIAEADKEDIIAMQDSIREQLRIWVSDPGMTLDEQKRQVRQLLAQWHPDKNRHMSIVATFIFQWIQEEVNRIIAEVHGAAQDTLRKEAEYQERRAQRAAEKSGTAAAMSQSREDKQKRKQTHKGHTGEELPQPGGKPLQYNAQSPGDDDDDEEPDTDKVKSAEWSLVIGHGPATTPFLRPWPRSHFSLTLSPLASRSGELVLFGGEAFDGRELMFYSDLYRLNVHGVDPSKPLPWEKIYSSVPLIPGPEPRSSHQVVAWGEHLYMFGGEWSSRDQRRYRQFGDLWRIDAAGGPGTRWQHLTTTATPIPRSGHRMAVTSSGHAVMFGGFSEDKRRRATYLSDLHALPLPSSSSVDTCLTWHEAEVQGSQREGGGGPGMRSGCLLWAGGDDSVFVFGGARPKKTKKGRCTGEEGLVILEDLWRAQLAAPLSTTSSSSSGRPGVRWEKLEAQGQGPGARSGLCQCAVSSKSPGRRIVFGGVTDLKVQKDIAAGKRGAAGSTEVALFHQDVFLLDCDGPGGSPIWTRLWPPPGAGLPSSFCSLKPSALPKELRERGGGCDAIVLAGGTSAGQLDPSKPGLPRGRIAAGCAVVAGALWLFGGACEAGPRQEVTLDDLWKLELSEEQDGTVTCSEDWECILPLSDRATMWFDDSESEDEDEEEEDEEAELQDKLMKVDNRGNGVLSKNQQKAENKKVRMELKRDRQMEKCEEKLSKREMKKDNQRAQALKKD